jgi:formylglycine-generating enzyme required for sulfatase activity
VGTGTLTISGLQLSDLGNYSVVVGNTLGRTQSKAVAVATFSVVLQIRQEGAQIVLTWNEVAKGMKLQRATRFANADWQEVAGSESVTSVTLPIADGGSAYFRLLNQLDPSRFTWIPAGTFRMGDSFGDGDTDERPVHDVQVSGFFMERFVVTKALWDDVYQWAVSHGYGFDNPGLGRDVDHPVHTINWWDAVKWCNARSEMEGRLPSYYIDASLTQVYRQGHLDLGSELIRWSAGYRLPTEAEWERAGRGGFPDQRFPWGNTITHSQANYNSAGVYPYDVSLTRGYHPTYATGDVPYTSPVGSFATNGYGLYDMSGNVWEWCWDWDGLYPTEPQYDPRGPASGPARTLRGGSWRDVAFASRSTDRLQLHPGSGAYFGADVGFRVVLAPGQP